MTDMGRRSGVGDMLKSVYDPIIAAMQALEAAHKTQHQSAGTDEIDVTGLTGTTPRAIFADATAGRILRCLSMQIDNGTNASTVKTWIGNQWNGVTKGTVDNIGKGATVGDWTLSADGKTLTWTPASDYTLIKSCISQQHRNYAGLDRYVSALCNASTVSFYCVSYTGGTLNDWTTHVDSGKIAFTLLFVTSA